jgi:hypothetical protein
MYLPNVALAINPGLPPDNEYFTIADTICVIESKYNFWNTTDCKDRISKISAPRDRRCMILHSAAGLNRDGYRNLVGEMEDKAGSIFVTDIEKDYYGKWGRNYPLGSLIGDLDHR